MTTQLNLITCFAYIDEAARSYVCKADPRDRWNGWAKPFFTKEVLLQALPDCGAAVLEVTDSEVKFTLEGSNEVETAELTDNGWVVHGWCWSLETGTGENL